MTTDRQHVIVEEGQCSRCRVHTKSLHHRHYPEIRAECGSIAESAVHLAAQLASYRESAQSDWHRQSIDLALADVAEFLDSLAVAATLGESSCRCGPRVSSLSGVAGTAVLAGEPARGAGEPQ